MNCQIYFFLVFLQLNIVISYRKYAIEDHDICSLNTKRKQILDGNINGLIVTQTRLNDHAQVWEIDMKCKFQVKVGTFLSKLLSSDKNGLVAVIQRLSLRQDEVTGECIDYVQFKTEKILSERYCGQSPMNKFGDQINIFDANGKIDTTIFVDKKELKPNEKMDLLIVYTVVKTCTKEDDTYMICADLRSFPSICVRNEFRNDTFFNCPNCADEGGCNTKVETMEQFIKHSSGLGTLALISSATALLFGFVVFLGSMWICKKFKLACWSPNFANGPVMRGPAEQQTTETVLTSGSTNVTNATTMPSAPPLSTSIDKDLPPAYESLFPDR